MQLWIISNLGEIVRSGMTQGSDLQG